MMITHGMPVRREISRCPAAMTAKSLSDRIELPSLLRCEACLSRGVRDPFTRKCARARSGALSTRTDGALPASGWPHFPGLPRGTRGWSGRKPAFSEADRCAMAACTRSPVDCHLSRKMLPDCRSTCRALLPRLRQVSGSGGWWWTKRQAAFVQAVAIACGFLQIGGDPSNTPCVPLWPSVRASVDRPCLL